MRCFTACCLASHLCGLGQLFAVLALVSIQRVAGEPADRHAAPGAENSGLNGAVLF